MLHFMKYLRDSIRSLKRQCQANVYAWFQRDPLTYSAEGLRGVMTPGFHGQALQVLDIQWVLLGLAGTLVLFLSIGIRGFLRRAIR